MTPPNFLWQEYLEKTFPGYPVQKGKQKMKVDEDGHGIVEEQKLNKKNTAIKFALDQTVGATVNNIFFLGLISVLRGKSLAGCVEKITEDLWPIMLAGYKLWPLVSIFNFTVVPMEKRIVVGSIVGVGWGVYLALKTAA
ncbi:hypothetical protein MMC30_008002 [Trapelia coarctata]|nr:hypothetical protein [Trapelia coarctata]